MGGKKTEIQLNKDVRTNNNTEQMIAHVYLLFFCVCKRAEYTHSNGM